jgi:hypothetical protein
MKIVVFVLLADTNVSEEHAASVLKVEALQCDKSIVLYTSTVKIEEACSFDTFVSTYKKARCHNQKIINLKAPSS